MYHEFDADAVAALLGIGKDDLPHGLILHGTYDMPDKVRDWRDRLANARVASAAFNVVIGDHEGVTVWYTPVLGPSMAATAVHCACVLGARRGSHFVFVQSCSRSAGGRCARRHGGVVANRACRCLSDSFCRQNRREGLEGVPEANETTHYCCRLPARHTLHRLD